MMTPFDKKLLNLIQTHLPIDERPFAALAEKLGATEEKVLERLCFLRDHDYIRKIGPFFNSENLGYTGTLIAAQVERAYLPSVAEAVNRYHGVTHNYEREGRFNLWFTLLTPDPEIRERIMNEVRRLPGVVVVQSLPVTKKYKISVQFHLQ